MAKFVIFHFKVIPVYGMLKDQIHFEILKKIIIYLKNFSRRRHLIGENKQRFRSIDMILIIKILQFRQVEAQ
jgi:hypothetical protein